MPTTLIADHAAGRAFDNVVTAAWTRINCVWHNKHWHYSSCDKIVRHLLIAPAQHNTTIRVNDIK
jgi:hypothetical protein